MGHLTFTISPWKSSIPSPIPNTNLAFPIPSTAIPPKLSTFSCLNSKTPKSARSTIVAAAFRDPGTPARDRFVNFRKYKGKMLGTLPSAYLKWVSKNLRAGDMEEWARTAATLQSPEVALPWGQNIKGGDREGTPVVRENLV